MLNLWKIYKYVSQRAARAVTLSQGVIAADMAQAMKIILDKPTIKNARQFATYEKSYLSHCDSKTKSRLYAPEVIIAIRSKAYIVEKPPINIFGLSDNNPSQGYVYVATSARRLREVKLGFTTLSLESRAQKFRSKYGYVDFKITDSAWTDSPKYLEHLVSDELQGGRANGIANKDSIEWYKCDRSTVTDLIDGIAVAKGIKIHRKSWEGSLDLRYQKGEYEPYGEFAMELFKRRFVGLPKFDGESLVVASVNGILETITADETKMLRVYFGLEDGCRKSIEETAQILNVHKRMVQEFKGRAMRKCKHPSRSEGLRDLFDDLFAHVSVRRCPAGRSAFKLGLDDREILTEIRRHAPESDGQGTWQFLC